MEDIKHKILQILSENIQVIKKIH